MKYLFVLLITCSIYGQGIPVIGDTTDLKAYSDKQIVILEKFGGGDETGGGLFRRIDSAYTEGTHAFDYAASDGLQWVRMQYLGGEMGAFTDLTAVTFLTSGSATFSVGYQSTSQTIYPTNAEVTDTNVITAGVTAVNVGSETYDTDDFIVLPPVSLVPIGHTIKILCNSGDAFELRTPAASGDEINSEDCDGTKEYLCTDTEVVWVTKVNNTIGWEAHAYSQIGAVVAAVVPD